MFKAHIYTCHSNLFTFLILHIPQERHESGMLPVDLFDPLYGVGWQGRVDGNSRHSTSHQVADHVIDRLEFLLQIIGVPAAGLGCFRGIICDGLSAYTTEIDIKLTYSSY